jgi:creatinine amidohydrolase/Fe(II)-dependent formamide hydrolase-like protein
MVQVRSVRIFLPAFSYFYEPGAVLEHPEFAGDGSSDREEFIHRWAISTEYSAAHANLQSIDHGGEEFTRILELCEDYAEDDEEDL